MPELIEQFHFLRPLWLLAIIPCLLLFALLWKQQQEQGNWQRVIAPELLSHLLQGQAQKQSNKPLYLLLAGWIIACIALSGPTWQKIPTPVSKSQQPLVVVVDMSYKMYASDVSPNRLSRVRYKLLDLFRLRKDGLSALVVYAESAHTVSPLTDDSKTLANLVSAVSPEIMPEQGDEPIKGIEQAISLLEQGSGQAGDILLITDSLPGLQAEHIRSLLEKTGHRLSILGIGSDQGAPISLPGGGYLKDSKGTIVIPQRDTAQLRSLAQATGGVYRNFSLDDSDLKAVLPKPNNKDNTIQVERLFDQWNDAGYWLVLLLLPLALFGFRKGWLTIVLVGILLPSPEAEAFEWQDLWKNSNQQAMEALDAKNPELAAEKFKRPDWKGEALYQANQFEAAAKEFAKGENASSLYNQGNALAKAGKLDEAIKAYDEALKRKPDMEDAAFNKKLLEDLKKQQQEQQKQGNSDQQQDQQNQDQNGQEQNQDQKNQQSDQQQDGQQNQQQNADQKEQENKQSASQNEQQKQQENEEQKAARQSQEEQSPEEQQDEAMQAMKEEEQEIRTPDQQAVDNWLKTIPDDPGGLLRRKFLHQQQQQREQRRRQEQAW